MTKKKTPKDLKQTIETEIAQMLEGKDEPSEGRMKLLKLGIGFLAVQAKLEESEYGGFFDADKPAGVPKQPRAEPETGIREDDGGGGDFFAEEPASRLPS